MEVTVVANTKPISDLRNYNEVLRRIDVGNPVFLTENGRGRYAILDMREYERDQAEKALFARIAEAEMRVQSGESYLSADELKTKLGI
jgi:PHD/YefM family antitoxin component YafN of YafNO toxin-antitoxin module